MVDDDNDALPWPRRGDTLFGNSEDGQCDRNHNFSFDERLCFLSCGEILSFPLPNSPADPPEDPSGQAHGRRSRNDQPYNVSAVSRIGEGNGSARER